jgi:hypothetical protein
MACTLAITGVAGMTTGGTLTSIVVSGQATNCKTVTVRIQCGDGQPQTLTNVAVDTATTPWTWTATFQDVPESCICSKGIDVTAQCSQKGQTCQATFNAALKCMPGGGGGGACPSITVAGVSVGDCNPDGTRQVQITYQLNGTNYSAHLVDSNNNTIGVPLSNVSGVNILSAQGNYTGTETFTVVVTQPANCAGDSLPIGIADCDVCPNVTFVQTLNPDPNSPGNYTVAVTAMLSSTSSYDAELWEGSTEWDSTPGSVVGSYNLQSPTESLPANTSRTYEVKIISPVGCSDDQLVVTAPGTKGGGGGGGGGGFGCDALLWTALGLIATGLVLGVIAICTGNVGLGIGAGITLAVGLALLAIWAWLCGRLPGGCGTLRTANCMVKWIIAYGWIIALLLGLLHGWACGVAAAAAWGSWGLVLVVIEQVQTRKNCPQPTSCSVLPFSSSAT